MPTYEMRCRICASRFEVVRSMTRVDDPAPCPQGHTETVRLLPTIAVTGRAAAGGRPGPMSAPGAGMGGGGCCGGGCGCG